MGSIGKRELTFLSLIAALVVLVVAFPAGALPVGLTILAFLFIAALLVWGGSSAD